MASGGKFSPLDARLSRAGALPKPSHGLTLRTCLGAALFASDHSVRVYVDAALHVRQCSRRQGSPGEPHRHPRLQTETLTFDEPLCSQPSFVSQRAMHVENRVNNNFPFRYEGESKTRFTVGFVSVATIGFSAPFLACAFQL